MMKTSTVLLIFVALGAQLPGQDVGTPRYAELISMSGDRAEDSYAIYSQLLKKGPIEWRDAKRKQWLIEDTTNAMPLDVPCQPASGNDAMMMNPHNAVMAPEDRQAEWREVLADYDQHCHDVVQLDRDSFKTRLPVHLLNSNNQQKFRKNAIKPPAEFADGAGLHRFTEVFFNTDHTLALVELGMWCGGRCGNWTWVVLERKENRWKMLPWVRSSVIS
jgi:hypothetical protein